MGSVEGSAEQASATEPRSSIKPDNTTHISITDFNIL